VMKRSAWLVLLFSSSLALGGEPRKVDPQKSDDAQFELQKRKIPLDASHFMGRVLNNDGKTVQLFLDAGFSPDEADDGTPPLYEAANRGYVDIVKMLLEAGAKPDIKNRNGETPLQAAVVQKQADCVKALAEAGANPNLFYKNDGDTPLLRASAVDSPETVLVLIDVKADVNRAGQNNSTPLLAEAQRGHPETVRALLKAGAKVNVRAAGGASPLMMAAFSGNAETVQILMKAGADRKDVGTYIGSVSPEIKKILQGGGGASTTKKK
jgi:ankyrin repeat protein